MRLHTVLFLGLLPVFGCNGGDDSGVVKQRTVAKGDAAVASTVCVDKDHDGFGDNCNQGDDCDDSDPNITDECTRCAVVNEGCPCEAGTKPMTGCKPAAVRATVNGQTGTVVCSEGVRYCRDGFYSKCEILQSYATFVPDK